MTKWDKSKWLNSFMIGLGIIVLLFGISFLLLYTTNRPNYRDIKKAYSKLQIPSDWKLVSERADNGVWGLFCWKDAKSNCPNLAAEYTTAQIRNKSSVEAMTILNSVVSGAGYKLDKVDANNIYCTDLKIKNNDHFCFVSASIDKIMIHISLTTKSLDNKNGSWAKIIINKRP